MVAIPNIQISGKSNLLVGFPHDAYASMHRLGEQTSMTQMTAEPVLHDVPGDSGGGPEGDPIEQQLLAVRYRVTFNLSKFDNAVYEKLKSFNVLNPTAGNFKQSDIGCLLHRDRSFRFVVSPSKSNTIPALDPVTNAPHHDAGLNWWYRNFLCCTITTPVETGIGTKFAALQFQMRAWRVPEGHPLEPTLDPDENVVDYKYGLIWNRDTTGVDAEHLPPDMQPPPV